MSYSIDLPLSSSLVAWGRVGGVRTPSHEARLAKRRAKYAQRTSAQKRMDAAKRVKKVSAAKLSSKKISAARMPSKPKSKAKSIKVPSAKGAIRSRSRSRSRASRGVFPIGAVKEMRNPQWGMFDPRWAEARKLESTITQQLLDKYGNWNQVGKGLPFGQMLAVQDQYLQRIKAHAANQAYKEMGVPLR
jgi:hypothetical protein